MVNRYYNIMFWTRVILYIWYLWNLFASLCEVWWIITRKNLGVSTKSGESWSIVNFVIFYEEHKQQQNLGLESRVQPTPPPQRNKSIASLDQVWDGCPELWSWPLNQVPASVWLSIGTAYSSQDVTCIILLAGVSTYGTWVMAKILLLGNDMWSFNRYLPISETIQLKNMYFINLGCKRRLFKSIMINYCWHWLYTRSSWTFSIQ